MLFNDLEIHYVAGHNQQGSPLCYTSALTE